MRTSKFVGTHGPKVSHVKRLRELEYENYLLKLLYTDLLWKTAVLKDDLVRGVKEC
jgi:hypothetical protein